jgi:tetratricopeptide (TPR) repeat protein
MPTPDEFDELIAQADSLREAGLYADALRLYERALRGSGGGNRERLWARNWAGVCLRLAGRYPEALIRMGELYLETYNQAETYELAFRSLLEQLESISALQRSNDTATDENLKKRLDMVEEGLRWLRDIGKETWRPALLSNRAETLLVLGESEQALDAAEEAYRVAKQFNPPGFPLGYLAKEVARIASWLGRHNRAIEVLEEMNGREIDGLSQLGIAIERVRTLGRMGPDTASEALLAARDLTRLADQIQTEFNRQLCYIELAKAAVAASSLAEARDALGVVHDMALASQTGDRAAMLRESRDLFEELEEQFPDLLPAWKEETEQAIEAMQIKRE